MFLAEAGQGLSPDSDSADYSLAALRLKIHLIVLQVFWIFAMCSVRRW